MTHIQGKLDSVGNCWIRMDYENRLKRSKEGSKGDGHWWKEVKTGERIGVEILSA